MNTAVVPVHNQTVDLKQQWTLAESAYKSGEFKSLKSSHQAMLLMSYGRELGFGPATSLQLVYSVNGTPALKANTIASLMKQVKWEGTRKSRYDYWVREWTSKVCKLEFFERDDEGKWQSRGFCEYTMQDAETSGLTKNPTYKKFARNMLFARAITDGARVYAPDCLGGIVPYCPEELGHFDGDPLSPGLSVNGGTGEPRVIVDAEFEVQPDKVSDAEFEELNAKVSGAGRNLANLVSQVGGDPMDLKGMTYSQFEACMKVLNNL